MKLGHAVVVVAEGAGQDLLQHADTRNKIDPAVQTSMYFLTDMGR